MPDTVFLDGVGSRNRRVGLHGDRSVVLTNREAVLASLDWSITGFALVRASLVRSLHFPEFSSNADEYGIRAVFNAANKVAFCDGVFYYRINNPNAISRKLSYRMFDMTLTQVKVLELLRENGFDDAVCRLDYVRMLNRLARYWALLLVKSHELSRADLAAARRGIRDTIAQVRSPDLRAFADAQWKSFRLADRLKVLVMRHLAPPAFALSELWWQERSRHRHGETLSGSRHGS